MTSYQFFYRLDTLQIDAVFRDCTTGSTVFKDPAIYVEVNVLDPPYEVTRDHKVILDAQGNVVDTEAHANPVRPAPPPEFPPNPGYGIVQEIDVMREKPLRVKKTWEGREYERWCYVTQDLKDAYDAGNLNPGDIVSYIFVDNDYDKPLAQQKVLKTW